MTNGVMTKRNQFRQFGCVALFVLIAAVETKADDWPMWRYDAQRSAASPNELAEELELLWTKQLGPRSQAWDDPLNLDLMTYDRLFEPIVVDGRLIVGFNDRDKVVAFDTETGDELWSAFAEGPVRMPPAASEGRVFFTSDDGNLYCVDVETGRLVWKFSGAPIAQHAIGNRRLTSAWPARGGPVVREGHVYFAASIWPFMGTFLYDLDARSGEVRWLNDRTGSQYIKQPHSAPSFAGVAPQGALVATESSLIVPGGRSVPAVFDRATGELQYFELNAGGKGTGGSFVTADDKHFYVHTRLKGTRAFRLTDGVKTAFMPNEPVLHQGIVFSAESSNGQPVVRAYDSSEKMVWEIEADGSGDLVLAGDQLIAAGAGTISVIDLPQGETSAKIAKTLEVDLAIGRLLVADKKLFAVSTQGHLLAFGAEPKRGSETESDSSIADGGEKRRRDLSSAGESSNKHNDAVETQPIAGELLSAGDAQGYAIWFGACDSPLVDAIASQSPFEQLIVVDPQQAEIDATRFQLDRRGLYGAVTVHHGSPESFMAPSYVAHMVFVDHAERVGDNEIRKAYESVRPYGGVLYLLTGQSEQTQRRLVALNLEQARVERSTHGVVVRREGALPGAADWTHQYGDIANTVKSNDSRVKLPLGILWFGGSSNMDVLPRHGHGPPEQVVGGRLFIQGMNSLSARDVYTGRVLWKREFEDLGTYDVYYDQTYENTPLNPKYNQVHIPGANARGTNYVVADDRVYIVEGSVCHALDPATGETLADFQLPVGASGEQEQWGYLGVYEDVLIGGLGFAMYRSRNNLTFDADKKLKASKAGFGSKSYDRAASETLVGFDRHSGKQLWKIDAKNSFWHNGIVAGGGKIYCLDRTPKQIEQALLRRGKSRADSYRIAAFDFRTGKPLWEINENIFGTWLGYSEQYDLLLQAGAKASDRLVDEVAEGMAVYHAADGTEKWSNNELKYSGPCILHNDLIITNANSYAESAGAFFIETGLPKLVRNPLTGKDQTWKIKRAYGCNNIIASENLLTFRSGAAGFYDLTTDGGTGNLGGFKSGCTSNLVVANGVLNAPDYTRTCSCSYQNQTSLALVHMPAVDTWTVHSGAALSSSGESIDSLSLNFGAPGDRRDESGRLWLEYPVVAGDSPPLSIEINPEATFFQRHSSSVRESEKPWLAASGAEGITDLRIGLQFEDVYDLNNGIPVMHADDDAEEDERGNVNLTSSDLELVEDSGTQVIAMRFNQIRVAQGTEIKKAWIQFTCDEPSDTDASLLIAAEDTGNAARFTDQSHDLTSRSRTAKEIGWQPEAWTKVGESSHAQRTPDLSELVQAVVDRDDWKPGNSMAFLISGVGKRVAASSKGGHPKAAKLFIEAEQAALEDDAAAEHYDLNLYFAARDSDGQETRFDIFAQDQRVGENVSAGGDPQAVDFVFPLQSVPVRDALRLRFVAKQGKPVLSGISLKRRPATAK